MKAAIDSALSQTYENIEIVVVNDGSDDNGKTRNIAKSYGKEIIYIEKENEGISTALNLGIEKMTGDYFSWLSHDDMFTKDKLKVQIEVSESFEEKKVIYSDYFIVDKKNRNMSQKSEIMKDIVGRNMIFQLLTSFQINGITTLIPIEIIHSIGKFNPNLKLAQDYDYWFRISKRFNFFFVDQKLAYRRIHHEMGSKSFTIYFEADYLYHRIINYADKTAVLDTLTRKEIISILVFLKSNNYMSSANLLNSSVSTLKLWDKYVSNFLYLWEIKGKIFRKLL